MKTSQLLAMVAITCVAIVASVVLVMSWMNTSYGENYTVEDDMVSGANFTYQYNLSESEIQDEWVTQTCMALQINSPACDMVYGGIMDRPSDGRLK